MEAAAAARVNDQAGFFSADAIRKANEATAAIARDFGKELAIETLSAVPAEQEERFRTLGKDRFFEEWSRQRAEAERVRGIYILITKKPGHVQVAVDRATRERGFSADDRQRLVKEMTAQLAARQYDAALLGAVELVRTRLSETVGRGAAAAVPGAGPLPRRAPFPPQGRPAQTGFSAGSAWALPCSWVFGFSAACFVRSAAEEQRAHRPHREQASTAAVSAVAVSSAGFWEACSARRPVHGSTTAFPAVAMTGVLRPPPGPRQAPGKTPAQGTLAETPRAGAISVMEAVTSARRNRAVTSVEEISAAVAILAAVATLAAEISAKHLSENGRNGPARPSDFGAARGSRTA